jgi:thymidylate synthase
MKLIYHPDHQYFKLVSRIFKDGVVQEGRNGRTLSHFGHQMEFQLRDNDEPVVPLLTTKRVAWKTCLKELLWFMRGDTHNDSLVKENVNIWTSNASREFLDSRGLYDNEEGDLGPVYGFQWRHFNGNYSEKMGGVDQLNEVIQNLKDPKERYGRRHIISAWNPCQINQMALPPCHVMFQFYVHFCRKRQRDMISCHLYQRSGDVALGIPFNIASYSFLTHIVADHCGFIADRLIHSIGDAHIYNDHINYMDMQMARLPHKDGIPKIHFKEHTKKYKSIDEYKVSDIHLTGYKYHPKIQMEMVE